MYQRRRFSVPFPVHTLAIVVLVVVVILVSLSLGNLVLQGKQLNDSAAKLRTDIEALKTENARLQERITYLHSDEAVEALAREQLGWIRPGDTAIAVVPVGSLPPPAVPAPVAALRPPNWLRWVQFLLGN